MDTPDCTATQAPVCCRCLNTSLCDMAKLVMTALQIHVCISMNSDENLVKRAVSSMYLSVTMCPVWLQGLPDPPPAASGVWQSLNAGTAGQGLGHPAHG